MFLKFKDMDNLEVTVDTEKIAYTREWSENIIQIFIQGCVKEILIDKKLYQALLERLEPVPLIEK